MSEVTRETEYPTTDYERAVEMLRRMAVQGDMGNGARVVKMHLDAIVEERDSLRARIEELDATIGQQAVDLAQQDVRIAAVNDLFALRPDTSIRTTCHDGVEYWEVPADEIRAALDGKAE